MKRFSIAGLMLTAVAGVALGQVANVPISVPLLNGIVIVKMRADVKQDGVPLKSGLHVKDMPLLQLPEFERVLDPYFGRPLTQSKMLRLQQDIILYYRAKDRPLVDVVFVDQDVDNGMVQILVLEGKVKELRVQDENGKAYTNGWSKPKYMLDTVRLRPNDVVQESRLMEDLDWLNRNPFRKVSLYYRPDQTAFGVSSIELRVDDRMPFTAYVGYENTGSRVTDEDRIQVGFNWGNAFKLSDHQLNYQLSANPSFDRLVAHSGSYAIPLPWRHTVRLSGYYLDVNGVIDENQTLEGTSYQMSFRYEIPLKTIGRYQHEVSAGIDFKSNDNSLIFNAGATNNTPTEIFQIAIAYSASVPDAHGQTSFGLQGFYSPGGVTDLNSDTNFSLSHFGATADYAYARINFERKTHLPADFTWILRGSGQIANGNLLPSEQMGLGGTTTVRGYEEREVNGDVGWLISNEIRTPAFGLLRHLRIKGIDDKLQFLAFWDYGEVHNKELLFGEDPHLTMNSVGVGLRYEATRHFSLRFDYGWQLIDSGTDSPDNSRGHIGAVFSY